MTQSSGEASSRGRRPGRPDTRGAIAAAAYDLFTTEGYDGTSMRGVARRAGVDPALVHHYFADKVDLLLAAVRITIDPRAKIRQLADGDPRTLGTRLVATALGVWQTPLAAAVLDVQREHPELLRAFVDVIATSITDLVRDHRGPGDAPETRRLALVETLIGGMIMTRFIAHIEPAASLAPREAVALLSPLVQQILDR